MCSMNALSDEVYSIEGFLSASEAELLYRLACDVPKGGRIVEIGSYRGKSTVCLGLGARWAGANVWAIDPHEDMQMDETTHYGMENHAALLANLVQFGVADVVRVVALASGIIADCWPPFPTDLLWIDGDHSYWGVYTDLIDWRHNISMIGRIALHDTNGHFPEVTKALNDFLAENKWRIVETVDSITVLERAK